MHGQSTHDPADGSAYQRALRTVLELAHDLRCLGDLKRDARRLLACLVDSGRLRFCNASLGLRETALAGGILPAQPLMLGFSAHEQTLRLQYSKPRCQA